MEANIWSVQPTSLLYMTPQLFSHTLNEMMNIKSTTICCWLQLTLC